MKVTLINTADAGGGAPAACMRLLKALVQNGVDVTMAVQQKLTAEPRVTATTGKRTAKANFLRERLPFIGFQEKDKTVRFAFSEANSGSNIADHPAIQEADILHLHWTNSGYLSINNLKQLLQTSKPVVWTLHDMWAFTGGCHYSNGCDNFLNQCGNCWMLRRPQANDLSHKVWQRKFDMLQSVQNLTIVSCSNWLGNVSRSSGLLGNMPTMAIPNPIDIDTFSPKDKATVRKKWGIDADARIILFGAANINDRRKGITYLVEALHLLKQQTADSPIQMVIFGKNKHFDTTTLPFKVKELSIISAESDLAEIYSAADVFVSPSLEDNLPNMIMESLACGTPVAAFNTGGIPDLIDHQQNGYLAEYKSSADLAAGIHHLLFSEDSEGLSTSARQKVLDNYTNNRVAKQYIDLYNSIL
ncbi:glycosyltransferase family 4 protein [Mucilaginibacter sp. JRF]|uniref:glycosyltransferase family 4 protein n=1 Tax=Mucilaginibacter sp. JRF TaxID=2780088 RepID=UPI0018806A22|nr:glycosyltransferase family 4 protein [Mucilaginibacter sp. JRF]MBE9586740.1 glycosyltransferase family 4 protein [Mucilaginibacter sp. JRF]